MATKKQIQIIILSSVLIGFISIILILGFSYKRKIEEGLLPEIILEQKLIRFSQFIKENRQYLVNPPQEPKHEIAGIGYQLFSDYFSSYLMAFPKNKNTKTREVICFLSQGEEKNRGIGINCKDINSINKLNPGDYFIIGISLNDLMERWNINYDKKTFYSFCGLITPYVEDPVLRVLEKIKLIKEYKEGVIICYENVSLNQPQAFIFSGSFPLSKADIDFKIFLVSQNNLAKIKVDNNFQNMSPILESSLLLWSKIIKYN